MQAAYYEGNKTIRIGTCDPVAPQAGEVQLKVSHVGICGTDLHIYHGAMDKRVSFPQIMGHEMSGTVAAIGADVSHVSVGDPVTVMPLDTTLCDPNDPYKHIGQQMKFMGIDTPGAFQSHWTVPAFTLHKLPASLSLKHGALLEPLAVACHDVRLANLQAGEEAVVLGGGPIGMLVALVAKSHGAHVTLSEISPYRIEFAKSLGLDAVNPKDQDLVAHIQDRTNSQGADVVFEVTGSAAGATTMTKLPRIRGRIVVVGIHPNPNPVDLFQFFWKELELKGARVYEDEDFEAAIQLADSGKLPLDKIITETRPLEDAQAAFERMDAGSDVMKIVLELS
ncbi:MAG: zinc-binding dehydrogenase [Deinococcota bacterium]